MSRSDEKRLDDIRDIMDDIIADHSIDSFHCVIGNCTSIDRRDDHGISTTVAAIDNRQRIGVVRHIAIGAVDNHRARDALASFVKYETLPPHLQEADEFYDERGVQWIPYNENASAAAAKNGDVRQASAEGAVNARETTPRGTQPQMRGAPNATLRGVK